MGDIVELCAAWPERMSHAQNAATLPASLELKFCCSHSAGAWAHVLQYKPSLLPARRRCASAEPQERS